jgi:hypothetical protein
MAHHGHPIITFGVAVLATLFNFAHSSAQENNRYRAERAEIKVETVYAFSNMLISKRFWELLGRDDDAKAAWRLFQISREAGMAREFSKGDHVSIDRQEQDAAQPQVCLRADGEPDCFWAPAIASVR